MTERDFETMLRFKAGAGIVTLCQWVRELYVNYEREISDFKSQFQSCGEEIDDLKIGGVK